MLAWTERSMLDDRGVDHLGMRVAGESCYEALVDFTTTVSWRPRYFPFYCWATKQAFTRAGGCFDDGEHLVDPRRYRAIFKHLDFAVVAATLIRDLKIERVVGSKRMRAKLRTEVLADGGALELTDDHVRARMGGFGVYAGPMRHLGLLSTAQGFDIPYPGTIGDELADAFGRSYAAAGVDVFDANTLSREELERLGELCALDDFAGRARRHDSVAEELALTRALLVNWSRFPEDQDVTRRVWTLGVILELHRVAGGQELSLGNFRAATLLGHASLDDGQRVQLALAPGYAATLGHWKIYQAHAFATLALESLLSLMLWLAEDMSVHGNGVELASLLTAGLARIQAGRNDHLPPSLRGWSGGALADCVDNLDNTDSAGALSESALQTRLWQGYWDDDIDEWAHASALLMLVASVRLSQLPPRDWLGHRDPIRLPPRVLTQALEEGLERQLGVLDFLRETLLRRVLEQHRRNALRKLFDQPAVDSQKMIIEGSRLVAISQLKPGTSNPRFYNAVMFMTELGYLDAEHRPTAAGRAVLNRLAEYGSPAGP